MLDIFWKERENILIYLDKHRDISYRVIIILPAVFWIIYLILLAKKAIAYIEGGRLDGCVKDSRILHN